MKRLFITSLGIAVLLSGCGQETKSAKHYGLPVAGITAELSNYRMNSMNAEKCRKNGMETERHQEMRHQEALVEAERLRRSMEEYQAKQEAEAEKLLWEESLSIEQVYGLSAGMEAEPYEHTKK